MHANVIGKDILLSFPRKPLCDRVSGNIYISLGGIFLPYSTIIAIRLSKLKNKIYRDMRFVLENDFSRARGLIFVEKNCFSSIQLLFDYRQIRYLIRAV